MPTNSSSSAATATPIVDWNQDGCVDYTEFSAAPYSLFDQLDQNRDGKLTPQELGQRKKKPEGADDTANPGDQPDQHPEPGQGGPRGGRGQGPGRGGPPGP